ncbi:MAG: hypothetical protein WC869_08975 [Phycisphaerae bacterium]
MLQLTVDAAKSIGPNTRFWQAAGCDFLYLMTPRPEGQTLLDRLEQFGSVKWLRNHYSLSDEIKRGLRVGGEVYKEDASGKPIYDFSKINAVFAEWVNRGIRPIMEMDYMPAALGSRGKTGVPKDWGKWADLQKAFTANLIEKFGREEVRKWPFEVWNEPDGYPPERQEQFYHIYDVFVDSVGSVDPAIRVGGPAAFKPYCLKSFLNHVVNGTNHVTGKKGTRIDFISFHIYGLSGGWLEMHPLVQPAVQRMIGDLMWVQRIIEDFPELIGKEFQLNEWGMASNFERTSEDHPCLEYRNSEANALFLAKLVHCMWALQDAVGMTASVALYWGFAWEAYCGKMFNGNRSLTTAGNVPKPILTAYEMLARLGDHRLAVSGCRAGEPVGMIATRSGEGQVQLLAYQYTELQESPEGSQSLEITLEGLPAGAREMSIECCFLDRDRHNTYRRWQKMGSPKDPAQADLKALMDEATLRPDCTMSCGVSGGKARFVLDLPNNGMCLVMANCG